MPSLSPLDEHRVREMDDRGQQSERIRGGSLHRLLQRRYVLALVLIATSLLFGVVLSGQAIERQRNDGREINLAGRQRMLSQRIAKLSLELQDADRGERGATLTRLGEELTAFKEAERGLRQGSAQLGLLGDSRLEDGGTFSDVSAHARGLIESVTELVRLAERDPGETLDPGLRAQIREKERDFLPVMDAYVFQLEADAQDRVAAAQELNYLVHGVALVLLFLEALFIFQPAVRRIRRTLNQLRGAEEIITEKNERLEALNDELKQTLVKVLSGMHPICMCCKSIRGDDGEWIEMTRFLSERTAASFSHGLCERCAVEQYPDVAEEILRGDHGTDASS